MKSFHFRAPTKLLRWSFLLMLFVRMHCALAQTLTVLHSFSSFAPPPPAEGAAPAASLILSNNTLYGTTEFGGNGGNGTVFAVNPDGSNYTTLYSFTALSAPPSLNPDGANPGANLIISDNLLYGTTDNGGSNGFGTVFVASLDGTEVTTLHSFAGSHDGATPTADLILAGGTLYGTTKQGGRSDNGTIFAINTNGTGFQTLYNFTNGVDGASPAGGLVLSGNTLYGTAENGGANLDGSIFAIDTNGSGFASLHSFTYSDGEGPTAALTLSGNTLYGPTSGGGAWNNGTLFAINTDGSNFTNLYSFTGGNDGSAPDGALIVSNNVLYGTATGGGAGGSGAIFAVGIDGSNFTNLYSFTGGADGMTPEGSLFLTNNILYGTAQYGGVFSNGTVFAVGTDGAGFTNLYSFTGADDGASPVAGFVGDTLYGTTLRGGNAGEGVIFAIQTDGAGFTNLHSFISPSAQLASTNSDGGYPVASLVLADDTLYGTTQGGGAWGNGTVFAVKTNGTGFVTLHTFTAGADGARPVANLVLSGNTLYGTTEEGGLSGNGTVFSVRTDGSDFTVLYRFSGESDGASPAAGLILSGDTLYGTTTAGGLSYGTVFAININGADFQVLYSFTGGNDGNAPQAGLTLSGNILYGTAAAGGTNGWGTVFSLQVNGSNFTLLHPFTGGADGGSPYGPLLLSGNTLYGTTAGGGISDNGTVFAVQTDGSDFTTLYKFTAASDGAEPAAGLVLSGNSTLLGTAEEGGADGNGTVFSIQTSGTDFVMVHSFGPPSTFSGSGNSDGAFPLAGLLAAEGTLYGTAYAGGSAGFGTVFSLLTNGSNFATLYSFTNGSDGAYPQASLIRHSNTLFSTAVGGGAFGLGTVFALATNGSEFLTLHSFAGGNDGANPAGSLLLWSNVLYGTTSAGGTSNKGTVFAVNPDGSGYATLYSFTGGSDGAAPLAGLVVWSNSWLLGTASVGGTSGNGTLFALQVTPAAQATKLGGPTLLSFSLPGGSGGDSPSGALTPEPEDSGSSSSGNGNDSSPSGESNGESWNGDSGGSSSCGGERSCSWSGGSSCGGRIEVNPGDRYYDLVTPGRDLVGDSGSWGRIKFDPEQSFNNYTSIGLTAAIGTGADATPLNWEGFSLFSTESGGAWGDGAISAYNPYNQTVQAVLGFSGGTSGKVPTGKLTAVKYDLYGAAAYDGFGNNGLIYAARLCAEVQSFQPLAITSAIYNTSSWSLGVGYAGTVSDTSPTDPTSQMWGTLYDQDGTSLSTFPISTLGGGAFTGSYVFHDRTMPLTVSLSYSSPCGESPLSAPAAVSLAPSLNFQQLSGDQWRLSWSVTSTGFSLETAPSLDRRAVWSEWTGPAPVQIGNHLTVTFTPGTKTLYFRLRNSL
jgi:uncharacterized repeat protein (TIGR03803 family)